MNTQISVTVIQNLRKITGAGIMTCKKALELTNGDFEKAIEFLQKNALVTASKKSKRETKEGLIESYIHIAGRIGVLLELNCESDFVAKRVEFKNLAKDICLQITSSSSVKYISLKDIPQSLIEMEKRKEFARRKKFDKENFLNKPENYREQIVLDRVQKKLKKYSLLNQIFIKDSKKTIEELIKTNITLLGENIQIARFFRYSLGETKLK